MDADTIVAIDDGKVVEFGTHNELLAKKGIYSMLWDEQTQGITCTEKKDFS